MPIDPRRPPASGPANMPHPQVGPISPARPPNQPAPSGEKH
jgi:hypothetical protein